MRALARDGLVKFEKDKDNNIVKIGKRNNDEKGEGDEEVSSSGI